MSDGTTAVSGDERAWLRAGQHAALGSRRHPRYELFILGELMGASQHGYHLHEILNRVLGPFRQISWGALYPLIHDLEREGLIEADISFNLHPDQGRSSNRQRRPYRITEAGRQRFKILMREPSAYTADYPELFTVKLNLFGYITFDEQFAILRRHRAYLQIAIDYLIDEQQYVVQRVTLPEAERPHILRFLAYRLSGVQAERAWIDGELARLTEAAG